MTKCYASDIPDINIMIHVYTCVSMITSVQMKSFLKFVYVPKTVLLTHRRCYVNAENGPDPMIEGQESPQLATKCSIFGKKCVSFGMQPTCHRNGSV